MEGQLAKAQRPIELILSRQLASYLVMPICLVDNSGSMRADDVKPTRLAAAQAAARAHFGTSAEALTAFQAASLAGTLPHPLTSNPTRSPGRMAWRRDLILTRMGGGTRELTPVPVAPDPDEPPVVVDAAGGGFGDGEPAGVEGDRGVVGGAAVLHRQHHLAAEPGVRGPDRVHGPTDGFDEADQVGEGLALDPGLVQRVGVVAVHAGLGHEPVGFVFDDPPRCRAESHEHPATHERGDRVEPFGPEERPQPGHGRGHHLFVVGRLEGAAVAGMVGPAADQRDGLALDQVGQGPAASGTAVVAIGRELDDTEAGLRVGVVDADDLARQLLVGREQ